MKIFENSIPPPLVALFFAGLMWLAARYFSVIEVTAGVKIFSIGVFILLGLLFLLSGTISFRRFKTTVNPLRPETASALVTTGVYTITRNPMYMGFVMLLCAWAVYLASLWGAGLIILYMLYIHRYQIRPEERALEALFGDDFIAYKRRVRPWL